MDAERLNGAEPMRVVCISDSFGLPRPDVPYSATWIARLKQMRPDADFIGLFRRLANTGILATNDYGEYLRWYSPQAVVVQLGICDCAPRHIRTNSPLYKMLGYLPRPLAKPLWALVRLKPRRLGCTDVSPEAYRRNISAYIDRCRECGVRRVVIVAIGRPADKMRESNPLIDRSIEIFNSILTEIAAANSDLVRLADPLDSPVSEHYGPDGYHPNAEGNRLIANAIADSMNDIKA